MPDIDPNPKTVDELSAMTVKQLRAYARKYGICLSYSAATKAGMVQTIHSQMEQWIREAEVDDA